MTCSSLRRALDHESGTDDAGTVLVRLNIDGEECDKVLVDHPSGTSMTQALLEARDAIEAAIEAVERLRKA